MVRQTRPTHNIESGLSIKSPLTGISLLLDWGAQVHLGPSTVMWQVYNHLKVESCAPVCC